MSNVETFNSVLKKALEIGASDVHVCAGGPFRTADSRAHDALWPGCRR